MFQSEFQYEMAAPDGTIIYRCIIHRSGWFAARWKGRIYPVMGGIRGPLWMTTAWGSSKA